MVDGGEQRVQAEPLREGAHELPAAIEFDVLRRHPGRVRLQVRFPRHSEEPHRRRDGKDQQERVLRDQRGRRARAARLGPISHRASRAPRPPGAAPSPASTAPPLRPRKASPRRWTCPGSRSAGSHERRGSKKSPRQGRHRGDFGVLRGVQLLIIRPRLSWPSWSRTSMCPRSNHALIATRLDGPWGCTNVPYHYSLNHPSSAPRACGGRKPRFALGPARMGKAEKSCSSPGWAQPWFPR
jgi:hypothetical protein